MSIQCAIQPRTQGGVTLSVTGRVDSATASLFDEQAEKAMNHLADGSPIVLDFSRVTFISSMGIRSLLKLRKAHQARGGAVSIIHMQPQVASVLQMANLYF